MQAYVIYLCDIYYIKFSFLFRGYQETVQLTWNQEGLILALQFVQRGCKAKKTLIAFGKLDI
jgi:hypothetical protein